MEKLISIREIEEQQRRQIAEDLHDHVGQALALVRIKLIELRSSGAFCGMESSIDEMRSLLEKTIRYTRTLSLELSPIPLLKLGAIPLIEWCIGEYQKKSKLHFNVFFHGKELLVQNALSELQALTLYRILSELLLNMIKHSKATECQIEITVSPAQLILSVEDNGIGFNVEETKKSFGMILCAERASELHGEFFVDSTLGKGTRASLILPL